MDATSLAKLLTPEGQELLASLPPYDPATVLQLAQSLRTTHDPELVAAALTQQQLRERASAKLGEFARTMLFTEAGLQQATRLDVAAFHARRYRDAGLTHVLDLGCGLGVDSLAMAGLGLTVTAVERDEATAALAMLNLRAFPSARVVHGDALEVAAASEADAVFSDPARRSARGRVFDPEAYSPPLSRVLALRERFALGMKVAPGIGYDHLPEDAHAQWVSVDGDVVEAGLWFGPLAEGPGRSALVLRAGHASVLHVTGAPASPQHVADVAPLGRYVVEPDGAVIRAGGVAALADEVHGGIVSDGIAYLTTDEAYTGPFGETFEVVESFPYSTKKLAAWARAADVGALEIKKRGVDVVPDHVRKALKLKGSGAATVILTRVAGAHTAIVVRRTR